MNLGFSGIEFVIFKIQSDIKCAGHINTIVILYEMTVLPPRYTSSHGIHYNH